MEKMDNKRIAVLLSGGVDSSVVVYELVRQGITPDCFYIRIGPEDNTSGLTDGGSVDEWDCSSEEDLEMATAVAHRYGCRLEVVDCHREYWDQVTKYTMEKVRAGLTPNPDVMCNRLIKFGAFHEKRGRDYDLIATGHYAQTEVEEVGDCKSPTTEADEIVNRKSVNCKSVNSKSVNRKSVNRKSVNRKLKWLCTSPDPVKDQTDFLAQIYDWQLEKAIFPIGHYMKDEVRQIAEREHLASARRKDSQGICFLGKIDYTEYLRRYLGEMPGDVVELEPGIDNPSQQRAGRIIGRHRGHWFYTIGQRKGLGFGGGPWFIVKKDVANNILFVSHGYDPATAYKQTFPTIGFHSINGVMPGEQVTFKIRHTPEYHNATLEATGDGGFLVHSAVPIHGVAPGQFCVVYDRDHHRCYGSAEISV